jgi:hypothetical protein
LLSDLFVLSFIYNNNNNNSATKTKAGENWNSNANGMTQQLHTVRKAIAAVYSLLAEPTDHYYCYVVRRHKERMKQYINSYY